MSKPIHILIVEDSEDDSLLILHELRRGGYEPESRRVDTPGAMKAALEQRPWDLVISDYILPGFGGLEALNILKERGLDLPFIIVSGRIGEDIAVGAMKAGAHDYIIKGNFKRLVPVVERELRDAEVRRERRRAEVLLDRSGQQLFETIENITDGFFSLDREWRFIYVNTQAMRFWRKTREELMGRSLWEVTPLARDTIFFEQYSKAMVEHVPVYFEALSPLRQIWVEARAYPSEEGISVYFHDITERKESEQRIRVTNDLLKLFTRKFSLKEYVEAVVELVHVWSGCRHMGVRIVDESGLAASVSSDGFNAEFPRTEELLSILSGRGPAGTDGEGPQPQQTSVLTPNGSFYSNDSALFCEALTEEQRFQLRGVCLTPGFTSLAVVPIVHRDKVLGAIHLADERKYMVPIEKVEFVERLALIVGEAVYRFGIEEELRRNYDALWESEARYRSLVEDVRDIIFTVKPDGTIASFSPAFESITGWRRDEWEGKHFFDLIHPDDEPHVMNALHDALQGRPVPLFELRTRTRSGEFRYLELKIAHERIGAGIIPGIARDVTERKRAEEDNARLASAVESAAEAVVITDPSTGVVQYVNSAAERITGYTKEEMIGRTLHFLQSGKHDEEYFVGLRETLAREGVWSGKLINKKKDGTLYFEECTVSPVKSRSGGIINYVYLKRDVTEKLRLESIAESVNTMNNIGYVFSGISHEIGNPVSSLLANLEVMKEKLDGPKEMLGQYVDRAMGQIQKIEYLLNSLRNFNMFEIQDLQDVRVDSFISQFLSLVSEDFTKKGIAIEVVHDPEAEWGRADTRALQQVMLNLFTNAADALKDRAGPKITVRTSRGQGGIRIRIEDNGCGMTVEQQEKLFKPFNTSKAHGTGLGMVIVKNMLSKMGGTIEVESVRNARTHVEITIPEGGGEKK
jgi:PAS domain S-box-containing protein